MAALLTRLARLLTLAPLLMAGGGTSAANPLIADLSSREIAITTGFAGTELLLFGATEGEGDIVVVVHGPARREVVRRKERVAGVWINGASVVFDHVPVFYFVASSRPLERIAPPETLAHLQIGVESLKFAVREDVDAQLAAAFRAGLIEAKRASGLYSRRPGTVTVRGSRLFRTSIRFPANVPTGVYSADVHLFRDGRHLSVSRTPVIVRKAGIEARIYDFAHESSALYGAVAILIALVAGWLAGVVFRRT